VAFYLNEVLVGTQIFRWLLVLNGCDLGQVIDRKEAHENFLPLNVKDLTADNG
jgi:hypothetical protein